MIDLEKRLAPWLKPVGGEGEGDVRSELTDIIVAVDGKMRVVYGRCLRDKIESDTGSHIVTSSPAIMRLERHSLSSYVELVTLDGTVSPVALYGCMCPHVQSATLAMSYIGQTFLRHTSVPKIHSAERPTRGGSA